MLNMVKMIIILIFGKIVYFCFHPMSYLAKKSAENQVAALKLYDLHKLNAPSIHCAYYSCIQLMIHVIMEIGGKTYEAISDDIRQFMSDKSNRGGSHVYYIKKVESLLISNGKSNKVQDFSLIKSLKGYREKSDYAPIDVTPDEADQATTLSIKICDLLKNEFRV